ncbi:MAG: UDP-N-acetylmuramate dehydrogenase [Clostridiaceae bacterium]|nr:UDP-N-acetylmuramate dehydrogenase [Clostridiaceae bacterium]
MQEIYEQLAKNIPTSQIKREEIMANHTSFKVGGKADFWIKIKTIEELRYIIEYTKKNDIPLTIVGNGTNLLVKDEGIRGITISLDFDNIKIEENDENINVIVGSGVKLPMLAMILQKNAIEGFEFASGIPGTIGGAIRMNAGAYGKEMKEIVKVAQYIDESGNIKLLQNEDMDFSYRHSRFKEKQDIIIEATLQLKKGNIDEIKQKMCIYKNTREEKQPIDKPSAGSTFKRGTNYIAAQLIDQAGLKGYKIGGAEVSLKHAGFIVNTGNATAKDILNLVDYIIKTVYDKFGKVLELEIEVLGE